MPVFEYQATDADGKSVTGSLEAESAHHVTLSLVERGLRVSAVQPRADAFSTKDAERPAPLQVDDLALLSEQLLTIVQSNLPLPAALEEMARDIRGKRLRRVVDLLREQVESGKTLDDAMSQFPEVFSPVFISLVRAGARTGDLPHVLSQLCTYSGRRLEMRNALHEAIAYPLFVTIAAFAVFGFLQAFVVPQFETMFASMGGRLPWPTRLVLSASHVLRSDAAATWVIALGAAALILGVFWEILRFNKDLRHVVTVFGERLRLSLPVWGGLYRAYAIERFSRTLAMLLASKTQATESLLLAGAATGSRIFEDAGARAALAVAEGQRLATALAETGLFKHSYLWLLGHGETNGTLDAMMLRLAESAEREVLRRSRTVMVTVGPILVIAVGLFVGFTVIAMFMPILQLSSLVR